MHVCEYVDGFSMFISSLRFGQKLAHVVQSLFVSFFEQKAAASAGSGKAGVVLAD